MSTRYAQISLQYFTKLNFQLFKNFTLIFLLTATLFASVKMLGLDTLSHVLESYWQYLDLPELFADPLKSLLYFHAQPPLLNTIIVLLNLLPGDLYNKFILVNSLIAIVVAQIIFLIISTSTGSRLIGIILGGAYVLTPSTLLNIAYPFYPSLTTLGYAILIYAFFIISRMPSKSIFYFVLAITYLSLLRSSFSILHTLFFLVVYYFYFKICSAKDFRLAGALIVTLSISIIVPIKNWVLYDSFGSSSWAPLNIAYGVGIPRENGYFISPEKLKEIVPSLECKYSYHFQDRADTKHNGVPNFNSCYVLEFAKIVKSEKLRDYDPIRHLKYFLTNTAIYFSPSDKYRQLSNRLLIEKYSNIVNILQLTIPLTEKHEIRGLLIILLTAAITVSYSRRKLFMAFCVGVIIIHYLSHTLTDGYESQRFIIDIEFIFLIIAGLLIAECSHTRLQNGSP
jgi:hypothetical protein